MELSEIVITSHHYNNNVFWRQVVVTDGIDNIRGLFHFPAGGNPGTIYDTIRVRANTINISVWR